MVAESFLGIACAALIAFLFGLALSFYGYRLFLFLLPIWGFFFGLWLGAQTMQALFGVGFLATVTSWVVGFIVGAVFAVLSYLFYMFAVAIIAGSLGYSVVVGLLLYFGLQMNFLVWLLGIVAAIALAAVTIIFNLQKWVIIIATSVMGAAIVAATFGVMFQPHAALLDNPVKAILSTSPLLAIVAIVLAVFGIVAQNRMNRAYTIEAYNHWE